MFGGSVLQSQNRASDLQYLILDNIIFQYADWRELVEDFLK